MKNRQKIIMIVLSLLVILFGSLFIKSNSERNDAYNIGHKAINSFYYGVSAQLCMVDFMNGNLDSAYQCEKYIDRVFEDYKLYIEFFDEPKDAYEYVGTK